MEETVIQRVRKLIQRRGVTPRGFASEIDFNYSTLNNYLTGRRKSIEVSLIERIVSSFDNVSSEWLITGNGTMLKSENALARNKIEPYGGTRPRIPMDVAAGSLSGFSEGIKLRDCEQIPIVKAFPNYDYTIIVKGNSMEPKYEGGDEIAISKVSSILEWGKVYVLDTRDGAILKRLYEESEGEYRCVSYNKEYPDFRIRKDDVFGIYKVVGLIRI